MVSLIFWGLLGVTIAFAQVILIRSFLKSIAFSGLLLSGVAAYKFYFQPHFSLPLILPEINVLVGAYIITKSILWFLRIWYGII